MKRAALSLDTLLLVPCLMAQDHGLPHTLAPSEVPLIPAYRESRAGLDRGITTPPDFAPRTMAEWEEVQALTIAWISYPSILKQIVAAAKTECEVVIVCPDQNEVTDYLMGNNAGGPLPDLDNISFVHADINSVWIRDYGAECIYADQVDSLYLLDWIYNRPRPDDDASADAVANALGIGIYSTSQAPNDLVHTGGNFMADGFGTAFSSNLVIDENGANGEFNQTVKTPAQVDALMQTWMGISNYIRMETLPYDGIHHIDMHMKLLDEETLLVGEFPQGESDGPQLDENMGIIMANETSVFGDPYRVIRIPMPPSTGGEWAPDASYRTYANNLFVNGTVIVPTYRTEYDTTALRILHEALPGYRIVGIDCDNSGSNIISASGAIHCITKGIGVNDPLLIKHQRLHDTYDTQNPYEVTAWMRHKTGIAAANLFWTTDTTQTWNQVAMTDIGDNDHSAAIPAQPAGTTVYYYVQGIAVSGKTQVRPIVAPDGWWSFRVLDANTAVVEAQGPAIADLFPNPCTSHVSLKLENSAGALVSILDVTGRTVLSYKGTRVPNEGRLLLDVSMLPTGTYALTVASSKGTATRKLMKH